MTEVSSLTGRLLVATPVLADPNFDRAVVLLLDHDEEGSLGVVLNRPTPVDVVDILEPWAALAGEPGVVFQGGPVSLDAALGVAVVPSSPGGDGGVDGRESGSHGNGPGSAERDGPLGWRRVHGAIGLVDLEAPPELLAAELGSLRIFAGYAGWGPGQLEKELSDGAWYVVESEPGDVSSPSPEGLWRSVLRRQRSELAMVATYPDDASLN
ncbi:YqgE/AlgH family protein [Streptomyces albidus (ex Kaewkla and Franco 2022)]|uniref:YqgE/AlgH family protein n=1 Tax=Streptomyces albidus (ex Kaewkla and Franco 2022) TaxID=722709 RepID=UPI0015EEAEB2|nr:YqgE/AlgH family protein [Streptomyces albidus (ex Kaewkla and Franco 2022)]